MYYINKKRILLTLYTVASLLVPLVLAGATDVNTSLPFERQPLYLEAKKAMAAQDYPKAKEMLLELGKFEPYKARSIRELGILETNLDMNQAVDLFKKAYNINDKESFGLYLLTLAQANRFDELTSYDLWGALYDRNVLKAFCLIIEHWNQEKYKQSFLTVARRVPIEITTGNLCLIRLLIKYGEPQDQLLIDFLNKELYGLNNPQLKALLPVRKFQFPDDATIENYRKTDEYKSYKKYYFTHYADAQVASGDRQKAFDALSILSKNPQYQTLANVDLVAMSLKGCDYLRTEQLCEVSLKIGDKKNESYLIYSLFMSLILQNKLDVAKKYESVFFNNTFSNPTDISPDTFLKYCLVSNNKEMFLKWIRSGNLSSALVDLGTKKRVLEGLEKWGEPIDEFLIHYIRSTPTKSNNEFDWSLSLGIPYNGEMVQAPEWQLPESLP